MYNFIELLGNFVNKSTIKLPFPQNLFQLIWFIEDVAKSISMKRGTEYSHGSIESILVDLKTH